MPIPATSRSIPVSPPWLHKPSHYTPEANKHCSRMPVPVSHRTSVREQSPTEIAEYASRFRSDPHPGREIPPAAASRRGCSKQTAPPCPTLPQHTIQRVASPPPARSAMPPTSAYTPRQSRNPVVSRPEESPRLPATPSFPYFSETDAPV